MKKTLFTIYMLIVSTIIYAVPAKRISKTVRQHDGSELIVYLRGDEVLHYYVTEDGFPLIEGEDGSLYYCKIDKGNLISTGFLAHNKRERSLTESSFLNFSSSLPHSINSLWSERYESRNYARLSRASKMRSIFDNNRRKSNSHIQTNIKRGLVILVNFIDKKMSYRDAQSRLNKQFNQKGYNSNNHIGSVRDYFMDQSYNQLGIDFDVVGPYELTDSMHYYGTNNSKGDDSHAAEMIIEACKSADKDVDYSVYDWDSDGEVEQVYVVYAGYGEASGAPKNTIWPHEWDLESAKQYGDGSGALILDGVKINTYACSNELSGTSGSTIDGIGTACHEFSHCLGLPDFYDTSGNNFGMDCWSLMDYGCYNHNGCVPCGFTSYERWYAGWLEPIELSEGCKINNMPSITDSDECYIIYNSGNSKEYYMLTNIQKKSWNTYASGHGLLIQHIDYDEQIWDNNKVNVIKDRQRCTIIPADNETTSLSLAGDPYPLKIEKEEDMPNNSLTNESTPSAILYSANSDDQKLMNKPIEEITETDSLISFVFNGGKSLNPPISLPASDITASSFQANWEIVEGASSYILELQSLCETEFTIKIKEDFSALSTLNNNTDLSTCLGDYTQVPGWSGSVISSTGNSTIKLGTTTKPGSIATPTINDISSGTLTIYIKGTPYATLPSAEFNVRCGNITKKISTKGEGIVVSFPYNNNESESVTITTTGNDYRAIINQIVIIDGLSTTSDIESVLSLGKESGKSQSTTTTMYKGIDGNSYLFSGLEGLEYWYRVKSSDGNLLSDWSNQIHVVIKDATSISTPLFINKSSVKIYNLNGVLITTAPDLEYSNILPSGIYIIKSGESVKKIIIK